MDTADALSIQELGDSYSSISSTLDETHFVTVLQDSSVDYVMVSAAAPQGKEDDGFPKDTTALSSTGGSADPDADFVVLSTSDAPASAGSWVQTFHSLWARASQTRRDWTEALVSSREQRSMNTFYNSYDWVSDTSIDGGRLILPGQLISLDDSLCLDELQDPTQPSPNYMKDYHRSQHQQSFMGGASTIMVSAQDLLALKAQRSQEHAAASPSTTSRGLATRAQETALDYLRTSYEVVTWSSVILSDRALQYLGSLEGNPTIAACAAGWIQQTFRPFLATSSSNDPNADLDDLPEAYRVSSDSTASHIELSTINETTMVQEDVL
eukprot:Nitzschia sp. Nitz4//scaffold284_size24204//11659//12633//NITZ4_008416-RA/size24204-processed-gene-0.1-mRNA-1//1//CDS//3329545688//8503//frame0